MKTTKKLLSVLLSVLMVMGCISCSFTAFAAPAGVTADQWNTLANALANDTVAAASFSGPAGNYAVGDPDGKILAAVEAYWEVFNGLVDKAPANQDTGNRTLTQVNASIKSEMQSRMGGNYATYKVEAFLNGLAAGASATTLNNVETLTVTVEEEGGDKQPSSAPSTSLTAPAAVTLTVNLDSALLGYDNIGDLPDSVIQSKSFTVNHAVQPAAYGGYKDETTTSTNSCGGSTTSYKYVHTFYYYYAVSSATASNGASISTQVIKDSAAALAPYEQYLDDTLAEAVALGMDFLNTAENDIKAAKNAVNDAFPGGVIWAHFFDDTAVTAGLKLIDDAQDVLLYKVYADNLNALVAAGYAGYDKAALITLEGELVANYNQYMKASETARTFIESAEGFGFDLAAAIAFYEEVVREIKLFELRELKVKIDDTVAPYYTYTQEDVVGPTPKYTSGDLTVAKGNVNGFITSINSYPAELVEIVMPGYTTELDRLANTVIAGLMTVAGYNDQFSNEYAKYVSEIHVALDEDMFAAVQNYDSWYTGLKGLMDRIKADGLLEEGIADKIFADLAAEMTNRMEGCYASLYAEVGPTIELAYDFYMIVKDYTYIDHLNVSNYARYNKLYGDVKDSMDIYNFLMATPNFTVPAEVTEKLSYLKDVVLDEYLAFVATAGFDTYAQQFMDIVNRNTYTDDKIKNPAVEDHYKVEKEDLIEVIASLDNLLTSDLVSELLGGLLNEDGSALDIAQLIKDMIGDMLFSDALINTLIQTLYPLLLGELVKVWANDLPTEVDIVGKVTYDKNLMQVANDLGIALYPNQMAAKLDANKYADNIAMLNAAVNTFNSEFPGAKASTDYFTTEADEDGKLQPKNTAWDSSAITNEDGTLKLVWGVDAVKESGADFDTVAETFYQAFDDAFEGLKKVLYALFANKSVDASSPNVAHVNFLGQKNAALNITVNGLHGFANIVVPIFDMLGVEHTAVSTIEGTYPNNTNGVADIFRAIISPLLSLIDKLGEQPLDTVIGLLPNLAYALNLEMLPKILGLINVNIHYAASVSIGCNIDAASDDISFNLGEMLDLNSLIDLSGGINSLLSLLGVDLPAFEQGKLAQMGELKTIDTQRTEATYQIASGKAYHIEADKADVAYYLLSYILGVVQDEEAFTGLLSMLMTTENEAGETVPDEEKIAGILATLEEIGLTTMDKGDAIAAICELFSPIEYDYTDYNWYDGTYGGTIEGMTPAKEIYLDYTTNWTHESISYILDNLDAFVLDITNMANSASLPELMAEKINALFTNANVTALAKMLSGIEEMLGGLLGGEEEGDEADTIAEGEEAEEEPAIDILAIIKDELGIDFAAFAAYADLPDDYNWGFEDGNGEGFALALVELLKPFGPVLDFLFKGEDITLLDEITLKGYNSYDSAFLPLLEALHCDVHALAEGEDALEAIALTLIAKMDAICADPIGEILNSLPGLLYFLASDGLSTAVKNLLMPVYAVLDAIRPIYSVDLNALLADLTKDLGIVLNLDDLGIKFVLDLVNALLGLDLAELEELVYDVCKVVGTEYESVSELLADDAKRGDYTEGVFDGVDMLTCIIGFLYHWLLDEENAAAFDGVIGKENFTANLLAVFESIPVEAEQINWMYDKTFSEGMVFTPTMAALTYPNDWTEETAAYITNNLNEIVNSVLAMTKSEYASLGEMLSGMVNIYTTENVQALVTMLQDLLGQLGDTLVTAAGMLLEIDAEGLMSYEVPADIDTAEEFASALADFLGNAEGLLNWIFFGQDITLVNADADFEGNDSEVVATLNGGYGYADGLVYILEALGVDAPEAKSAADLEAVLLAAFARLDEILANPVDEVFEILPNLFYFLNANGISVSAKNLLAPVLTVIDKLAGFGVELDLIAMLNDMINEALAEKTTVQIDVMNLTLETVFGLVEDLTGLELGMLADIFVNFYVGKIEGYQSAGGNYAYRMVYDTEFAKYDMVTILVTMALLLASDEDNAKVLDEMIGTDIISALKDVFAGKEIGYVTPDWDYCWAEDGIDYDNNTVSVVKNSFAYPNDWTEAKAQAVTENLPAYADMIAGLIDENYESLGALLAEKAVIFTTENIEAIIDALAGLLGEIDASLLAAAGLLLDVDVNGLLAYEVKEVATAEEFATELAYILSTYANGLVEWLFFGRDYKFFVDETKVVGGIYNGEDIITINGANGYAEGLALLLEALGCENLPAFYDVENFDSAAAVEAILVSACTRVEAVLANPVEEVFNLLPNLLYFLNANGVSIVVDNLIAGVVALLDKLSAFGLELDLNEVLDLAKLLGIEEEVSVSIDNLTVDAVLELAEVLTDLDLTLAKDVLVGFALGEVKEYESVSKAGVTYKMYYHDDFAKYDMTTALVTVGLMLIGDPANAEVLDEMLGTDIISALRKVFASVPAEYITPDWDYCWAEDGIDYTNNTVQVMKMAIEYPNNWTEESAKYVADNLGPIGDLVAGLIDSNYNSLAALVADKVTIYSSANIQAIVDAVAGLLGDIDIKLLDIAGLLLDANITGLVNYTAPEGIDTAEEFAAELANVLNTYAGGLVEWLFFGNDFRFFVDENAADGYEYGEDAIVINGANGYAEGLALILEALGVAAPAAASGADLEAVLLATFTRVDEVLADPVNEVFELLPNLLYFLNANGVSVAIDNLIAGVEILLDKLAVFGLEVNIDELLNIEDLLGIEKDLSISLDNLTVAALLEVAAELTGLDARLLNDVLVGFALGEVVEYESVCALGYGYKMVYNDEFAKHDMITVLATLVVMIAEDEANAAVLKDLLGEDIYQLVLNIFNMSEIPVQEFDWAFTEYADTDYVFSALETSELFADFVYGPLYTEEMAQYIADNFGDFIDNLIYLLGIQIDGLNVNNLQDLINGLINGNLYNSANIIAIRDALAGVAESISSVEGGDHIKAILKTSLGVDIDALVNYEVAEFTNDRAQFTTALCELLDPLFPLLKWLLADQNFTFFLDEEGYDAITLFGAEGYAYGIIPLLEVLDCDGILTKDSYYAQVANDDSVLLTSILNPLFDRIDEIMLDPAQEIFAMLPNIIYFINSNGLDTVVKNTLSAVYVVFNAIEPIAKIDLYEMLGIRLDEVNMNTLIELAFDLIKESTGYEFDLVDFNAILELTTGKLESYYSANGKLAYRMVYTDKAGIEGGTTAEMVTIVLRMLVAFINQSENGEKVLDLLQSEMGMNDDARKYVAALFATIQYGMGETDRGIDASLATLYYVFYGLDIGVEEANGILKDINKEWQSILEELGKSDDPNELSIGNLLAAALDTYLGGIFDSEGLASNGLIEFFTKIIDLFKAIINWFKNLFN